MTNLPHQRAIVGNSVRDKLAALEEIRTENRKEYIPLLKQRLVEEENVQTTVALIETIVEIDEEDAAAKCALRLWDSHPKIRAAAIMAIGKRGKESNVRVLTRFLEDDSRTVQEQAEHWLRKRGMLISTSYYSSLKIVTVFLFIVAILLEGLCFHLNLFAHAEGTGEDLSLPQIAAEALCQKRLNGKEAFQHYKSKNNLRALQTAPELFQRFQSLSANDFSVNLTCDDLTLEPMVKRLMKDKEDTKAFKLVLRHSKLPASERLALDIIAQQERKSSERADEWLIKAAKKGLLTELAAARKLLEK